MVCNLEKSDFQRVAEIIKETFPGWGERLVVSPIGPATRTEISLGARSSRNLQGIQYRNSSECFIPFAKQLRDEAVKRGLLAL